MYDLETIIKSRREWDIVPNLHEYEAIRQSFSWEKARAELERLPNSSGLNIAHEAVVRHATGQESWPYCAPMAGQPERWWIFPMRGSRELTNRFANMLARRAASAKAIACSSWPAASLNSISQRSAR
ncbi:MAG: hypothetical protein U0361_19675 [Nitrospiraceae bacterium]